MTSPHNLDELAVKAEAFERALRIRIWNSCKARNMNDDACYKVIRDEIAKVEADVRISIDGGGGQE
jgi:hypothetical protein